MRLLFIQQLYAVRSAARRCDICVAEYGIQGDTAQYRGNSCFLALYLWHRFAVRMRCVRLAPVTASNSTYQDSYSHLAPIRNRVRLDMRSEVTGIGSLVQAEIQDGVKDTGLNAADEATSISSRDELSPGGAAGEGAQQPVSIIWIHNEIGRGPFPTSISRTVSTPQGQ